MRGGLGRPMRTSDIGSTNFSLNHYGGQIQFARWRHFTAGFGEDPKSEPFLFSECRQDSHPHLEKAEIDEKIISQVAGWL